MSRSLIYSIALFFFTACQAQEGPASQICLDESFDKKVKQTLSFTVPTISPIELSSQREEVIVLDAREIEEYNVSHIPGAIHIGYNDFQNQKLSKFSTDQKFVLYCSIGYRSEKIAEKMQKMGYKDVHNLYGSIFEWVNQGYEVVDVDGDPTNKVHTYNKKWSKWLNQEKGERVW